MKIVQKRTARSFLDYLRPDGSRWSRGTWIFRGQADARWRLLPTAFREDQRWRLNLLAGCGHFGPRLKSRLVDQLLKEVGSIGAFLSLADEIGIDSPWSDLVDVEFQTLRQQISAAEFPPASLRGVFALAQHHGVPTRLLDWTRSAYIAAFFAASELVKNRVSSPAIVVWAADIDRLPTSRIETFSAAYGNQFQRAQRGVFTWDLKANEFFRRDGLWPAQEEAFFDFSDPAEMYFEVLDPEERYYLKKNSSLLKVTLPAREAADLLIKLFKLGISKAHLMPSLGNVVDTLVVNAEIRGDYHRMLEAIAEDLELQSQLGHDQKQVD